MNKSASSWVMQIIIVAGIALVAAFIIIYIFKGGTDPLKELANSKPCDNINKCACSNGGKCPGVIAGFGSGDCPPNKAIGTQANLCKEGYVYKNAVEDSDYHQFKVDKDGKTDPNGKLPLGTCCILAE